ncbi:YhgE/Pip domain-containing protein [Clostridium sp. Ade.TY]|uniref:YhgE/Pip domain-containing protein n=1 Tax=Clostridium sp. Ade.TY TaxID=1391647 RepID=UPI00041B211B|nr:YhgE/Pip domain-containing protein [Clostridium sp. Ade.TY]
MENIFKIFKRDIKNIFTNWVAIVVLCGLIILPSLYAWFNIKSSWDPYGSTSGIRVAVVNEDKGTEVEGKTINVGEQVVDELSKNHNIGWKFVSKEKAEKGVKLGDYFASIVIPEDFSKDLVSPVSKEIVKPKLIYTVNEVSNAIAPKITDKGVQSLKDQVDKTVSETVDGAIFKALNQIGIEYKSSREKIREIVDTIYKVNDNLPKMEELINKAYDGTITIDTMIKKMNKIIPNLETTLKDVNSSLDKGKDFINKSKESLNSLSPIIKEDLIFSRDLLSGSSEILGNISEKYDKEALLKALNSLNDKVKVVYNTLNSVIDLLQSINKGLNSDKLTNVINKLKNIEGKTTSLINDIAKDIELVNNNVLLKPETINKLKNKLDSIQGSLNEIIGSYDSTIVPAINESLNKLDKIAKESIALIKSTQDVMPNVKNVLDLLSKGTKLTNEELIKVKNKFPEFKKSFNKMTNDIKKVDKKEDINKILDIITGDWKEKTNFLVSPVQIETNKLFPVPNYGSAMSPFYTTLALWVGGLILVSILTVSAKPFEDGSDLKPMEVYFGKYLLFAIVGILQGAIVTLGDILILKTYVTHPVYFVLFGMFTSLIFITIIYSTVSVFGNVGKAICIIFLVLQVAASGGTFPVEVMSGFFQGINPYLPFRYAIEAMRGFVGGIVPELIQRDFVVLIASALIFIIIAILLKKTMNKSSEKFVEKLKESEIVEH